MKYNFTCLCEACAAGRFTTYLEARVPGAAVGVE